MAKYVLTKNFTEIAESGGVLQNLSGDSNIEITANTNEQGILLKPFQMISFSQKVYARKISGAGTAQLTVLPRKTDTAEDYVDENVTSSDAVENPYADFENIFKPRGRPHFSPPPFFDPHKPLDVKETPTHYLVAVSKDSLHGQKKFLIQFNEDLKG